MESVCVVFYHSYPEPTLSVHPFRHSLRPAFDLLNQLLYVMVCRRKGVKRVGSGDTLYRFKSMDKIVVVEAEAVQKSFNALCRTHGQNGG